MNQERLNFFRELIRTSYVSVIYDIDTVDYSIDLDNGTSFEFSCVYTTDDKGRPGRYYAVSVNHQVLCDGFCLDNHKPTEITKNLMNLVLRCSNKVLAQEMRARQAGLLSQIEKDKTHS